MWITGRESVPQSLHLVQMQVQVKVQMQVQVQVQVVHLVASLVESP